MDFIEDLDQLIQCPACDSEQAPEEAFIGVLGNRVHFRCRCCGMGFSEEVVDDQEVV